MLTLTDYVVLDRLYSGGTGPEAQVGDEVRLYLDTDAIPGFPEYIIGVIQNPIVRVNCETSTSYSVEYDEADLLGAVEFLRPADVINSEVTSALDELANAIEVETAARIADVNAEEAARIAADATKQPLDADLTAFAAGTPATALGDSTAQANRRGMIGAVGTAAEITTALQGVAADDTKIGAEYLPDVIPAQLQLEDTTGLTLSSGILGADADGYPVAHDGVTVGGVALKYPTTRIAGTVIVTDAEANSAISRLLGEFPCKASDAVAGKVFRMRGRIWTYATGVTLISRLGISTVRQRVVTSNSILPTTLTGKVTPSADDGTVAECFIDFAAVLGVSGSYLNLTAVSEYSPIGVETLTASSTLIRQTPTVTIYSSTLFSPATAESVRVYFASTLNLATTSFRLSYDLEFYFE